MEDDQSTNVVEDTAPVDDPILNLLTNDDDTTEVEDTPVEPVEVDTETPPEEEPVKTADEDIETLPDPKEEARRRYDERQEAIAQRRQSIESKAAESAEVYLKASEDEYDQRTRAIEAREAQREAQQYVNNIEHNENVLLSDFERVKANPDLQLFNPENKSEFNQRAYDKAIKDFNAGYISYDQDNNITGIKGSLLEHLTEASELYQGFTKSGQVKQVRATQRMRSNADTKPAASHKETTKDPLMDILKSD